MLDRVSSRIVEVCEKRAHADVDIAVDASVSTVAVRNTAKCLHGHLLQSIGQTEQYKTLQAVKK